MGTEIRGPHHTSWSLGGSGPWITFAATPFYDTISLLKATTVKTVAYG